jgi:GNAT superfamily N-acetyltransferase
MYQRQSPGRRGKPPKPADGDKRLSPCARNDHVAALIRSARPDDAADVARLLGQLGYPSTPDQVLRRLSRLDAGDAHLVLVCEFAGRLIGLVTAWAGDCIHRDGPIGRVTALIVADGQRQRGTGSDLLARAEAWLRRRGATVAIVNAQLTRAEAHRFYESRGYAVTGKRFSKLL